MKKHDSETKDIKLKNIEKKNYETNIYIYQYILTLL